MDFQTSIKTCFNKFAVFSGRASRSEFWFFVLFGFLGGIIAIIIDVMILGYPYEENGPINLIFSVAIIIPSIAVAARRLHDINKTGWWQLLWITIIGGILLIIWHATEGENKKNKFGPPIKFKK
tara:strand:- start:152 stop:523 length:372 start_codon:yes stop_codon:yes gene_type:complete